MTDRIEAKVASIIDSRLLVLNRGADHGVEVGARFAVLSDQTVDITDPDDPTATIGALPIAKTIVKVVSVQDRMAVAQTFRTLKSNGILPMFGPREWSDSIETDESTVVAQLGAEARTVQKGDSAVEIPGGEEFDGAILPFA